MAATRCEFRVAPNIKMFLMKYSIGLPNLFFSSQNAQLFCYAAVLLYSYRDYNTSSMPIIMIQILC